MSCHVNSFRALRFAARGPAALGKNLFFAYPALIPQRASAPRKHAGLLPAVPAGLLSEITIFHPSQSHPLKRILRAEAEIPQHLAIEFVFYSSYNWKILSG